MKNSLVSRWVFLRLLGVSYLFAFLSLYGQVAGLIGPDGILPAARYLAAARSQIGPAAYVALPTVFWFGAGNVALKAVCAAGAVFGALIIADVATFLLLPACWILYLSLVSVGGDFLSFQWDALLLETGFLAIFLPCLRLRPCLCEPAAPPKIVVWLFRLLLFRLMFFSGWVKLASGDPMWRSLEALRYHFETQPLLLWTSWYVAHWPDAVLRACTGLTLFVELAVPFSVFLPPRGRAIGCWTMATFQVLIIATGNYGFFNLLTIAICLAAMDDAGWPRRVRDRLAPKGEPSRSWPRSLVATVAVVVFMLSGSMAFRQMFGKPFPFGPSVAELLSPLQLVNGYGLFAVMTTSRMEITVEGSNDGRIWVPYRFRYKPEDVTRRPRLVAPFQPRLDWQMWFAALGTYRENPWFVNFCVRLLQGKPEVLGLLAEPFPGGPPRFIRARLDDYRFSDPETKRATGAWWVATPKGLYLPPFSLEDFRR